MDEASINDSKLIATERSYLTDCSIGGDILQGAASNTVSQQTNYVVHGDVRGRTCSMDHIFSFGTLMSIGTLASCHYYHDAIGTASYVLRVVAFSFRWSVATQPYSPSRQDLLP